jgi:hypothetical protein
MKTILNVAAKLFTGRNSPHLALRFEYHLFTLIGLLMLSAAGGGFAILSDYMARTGQPVPAYVSAVQAVGDVAWVATVALGAYLAVGFLVLLIVGNFTSRDQAPEDAN